MTPDADDKFDSNTTKITGITHPDTTSAQTVLPSIEDDNHPNHDNNIIQETATTTSTSNDSLRHKLGRELAHVSDLINNNLIVVRYATFSTVLLLGVYGIANTPLFYRYKHVLDIPSQMFQKRRWIHGRIVGVVVSEDQRMIVLPKVRDQSSQLFERRSPLSYSSQSASRSRSNNDSGKSDSIIHHPILVLFRHSSPMERLLERLLSSSPSSSSSSSYTRKSLLRIELAGISAPPPPTTNNNIPSILSTSLTTNKLRQVSSPFPLLNQLVDQKSKISLQLLAQRRITPQRGNTNNIDTHNLPMRVKDKDDSIEYTAICHLHYYNHSPQKSSWFNSATCNASLEMVQSGQAWINPTGGCVMLPQLSQPTKHENTTTPFINFHPTVKQLKDDAHFVSRLEQAEYSAWKSKRGIWSSEDMRGLRTEYYLAEEEESSSSGGNTKWQLVWNIVKKGWKWMRQK